MTITTAITGAGSGIGAATRALLESQGQRVIGIDMRNSDICADLSTPEGRQQAIDAVLEQCGGRLDHLVCCAGLGAQVSPASLIVRVNYFGVVALLDALLPALQQGQAPSAVVVSSNSGKLVDWSQHPLRTALLDGDEQGACEIADSGEGFAAYSCSKYAVAVAVRQRALAWGNAGVRLNAVAPGAVETPLLQAGLDDPRFGPSIRNFKSPLGRFSQPAEIAETIAFLLGEKASYVHGNVMLVDGGIDAQLNAERF